MSGHYVTDEIVNIYKNIISNVREDLGRTIQIYYVNNPPAAASGDGFDPVNSEPINPNDSVTRSETVYTVNNVSIAWGPELNPYVPTPGGRLEVGQCRVSVNLEKVLVTKGNVNGETYFDKARLVIVDGKNCRVVGKPVKTGLRDLFSCICICQLVE